MNKIGIMAASAVLLAGSAGAALLVEEQFDYTVGSVVGDWNGGTGFVTTSWYKDSIVTASAAAGLTFGTMDVSGASAHITMNANVAYTGGRVRRQFNNAGASTGDLWMSYLYQFDTAYSTTADDEWMEFRPGVGNMRTGIDEANSAIEMRYGEDWTTSTANANVKNGTTLLIVTKFADLGAATGLDGRTWALTAAEYEAMMADGGASQANLDTYAAIKRSNDHPPTIETMAGNVTFDIAVNGRNSSTPGFYYDEMRLGTDVTDVVAIPEPATLGLIVLVGGGLVLSRRLLAH